MARPSDPLLRWLRKQLDAKSMNTAMVAAHLEKSRPEVRRVLSGAVPMMVDDLLQIASLLDLDPSALGVPGDVAELDAAMEESDSESDSAQWGNQPSYLFKMGFDLGCDFMFIADTAMLEGSGVPRDVLVRYQGKDIPIQLDAAYHRYNEPKYDEDSITITLSFDALYDCTFPWSAIKRFVFTPYLPEVDESSAGTHLRLVT